MADRLIKSETLHDIADAIRAKTGLTGTMPVRDFASNINSIDGAGIVTEYDGSVSVDDGATPSFTDDYTEGYDEGYNKGYDMGWQPGYDQGRSEGEEIGREESAEEIAASYERGKAEGITEGIEQGRAEGITEGIEQGKQAERATMWNTMQNNGGTANYYLAFAYGRFTDENYHPLHPIRCSNGSTPGMQMFYNSTITDTKVEIYANNNSLQQAFNSTSKLHTIRKLHVYESTKYTNTFDGAVALENIEFEGTIGQSISFATCPQLTKASFTNIMQHLSTTATLTATFLKSAVNWRFETSEGANDGSTSPEWLALVNAIPNATIVLQ